MRILYICHRVPYPPNKGEKIRAFHQIRALASRHDVDLFSLADPHTDREDFSPLHNCCRKVVVEPLDRRAARWRSLPYLLTREPLTLPCFYSEALAESIRAAVMFRRYDRVFVYCSAMAQYVSWLGHIPIFTDLVDVDSDKWRQYAAHSHVPASLVYRREAAYLRRYERLVCRRSYCVLVTTEREARLVRQIRPRTNVQVLVNGVDPEFFRRPEGDRSAEPAIVFTGDMSYLPNVDAVTSFTAGVFPLVRRVIPEARFLIVGRDPAPRVQKLKDIPGVEVTGYVDDVRKYLLRAQVSVAPFTIAAGIQNKVLEALAYELPVVATPNVQQSLSGSVAEILRCGESPEELAGAVVELLKDRALAYRLGAEGRHRAIAAYDWARSGERLLELMDNAAMPRHEFYSDAFPKGVGGN